jgi:hypothetical protein
LLTKVPGIFITQNSRKVTNSLYSDVKTLEKLSLSHYGLWLIWNVYLLTSLLVPLTHSQLGSSRDHPLCDFSGSKKVS